MKFMTQRPSRALSPLACLIATLSLGTLSFSVACGSGGGSQTQTPQGPIAPSLTVATSTLNLAVGEQATLEVTPQGTAPFTYQWSRSGKVIDGATDRTYRLAPVTLADDNTTYEVKVSNSVGSTQATIATLRVGAKPAITVQPVTQNVIAPASATFSVTATGSNLSYQWARDGQAINGATAATYTTGPMDFVTEGGAYTVTVTSGNLSTTSSPATVVVKAPEPTYAGDPLSTNPVVALPSFHQDPVRFPNGSFRVGYSEALKNPLWTAYAIFRVSAPFANGNRTFKPDTRTELQAPRVEDNDMGTHGSLFFLDNGQGFDRGHMVTMSDLCYRYNRAKWADGDGLGEDSCRMTNIVAQVSYHNQRIWQDLEETVGGSGSGTAFTNGVTRTLGRAWIYSGPIFEGPVAYWQPRLNQYATDPGAQPKDPNAPLSIGIPTALYKVVVAEPAPGQKLPRVMAWVSSNRQQTDGKLSSYLTSLKRVEDLTGLTLLPALTKEPGYDAWRAGVDVRGFGQPFEQATGPNVHILQPSWDLVAITTNPILKGHALKAGDTVNFLGAATPNSLTPTATLGTPSWTFSDGSTVIGNATGTTASYTFTKDGTYTASFSVTDSNGVKNTVSRLIQVGAGAPANQPPTIGTLADQNALLGTPLTLTFKVSDDLTPAGNLTLNVESSNPAVLPVANITTQNVNGDVTLKATPLAVGASVVKVTVNDGSLTKSASFTLNVADPAVNNAPVIDPIGAQRTAPGTPLTVNGKVKDDRTSADALTIKSKSSDQAVLPDAGIKIVNTAGALAITLTPAAEGTATVTLTPNDGTQDGQPVTFTLTVDPASSAAPSLIISQVYEGASNNKWIEITNIGSGTYDGGGSAPLYLGQWNNPESTNTYKVILIPGTLAPGATMLFRNSGAVLPAATNLTTVPTTAEANVCSFNGNDPIFITPVNAATVAAWDARIDVLGDASWGTGKNGENRSLHRKPGITGPVKVHDASQWIEKSNTEVDAAGPADSFRLGFHIR